MFSALARPGGRCSLKWRCTGHADETRHRPRRPTQRRQVDALQSLDEDARRDRRRLCRPDARSALRGCHRRRPRVHRHRHRRIRAREPDRHRQGDGAPGRAGGRRGRRGGLRRRRSRRRVCARPRHRALPANGRQARRPRRQQGRGHAQLAPLAEFYELASRWKPSSVTFKRFHRIAKISI